MYMFRKKLEDILALLVVQLVDLLGEHAVDKQALPTGNRVDPNDGMRRLEVLVVVEGAPSVSSEGFAFGLGGSEEEVASVFGGEAFEEFAVGWGETVVELVSGGPESVCKGESKYRSCGGGYLLTSSAFRGELSDLQRGVVGRRGLEATRRYRSAMASLRSVEKAAYVTSECYPEWGMNVS